MSLHSYHSHHSIAHSELHVFSRKQHSVHFLGNVLILRTRVKLKHTTQRLQLFLCERRNHIIRHFHLKPADGVIVDKAAAGVGMGVGINHIGLNVVDGSAVHKVGPKHMNQRTIGRVELQLRNPHRRESQPIRAEGRACGKHAHPHVSTKQRRTHHRTRSRMAIGREAPYKPQIVETLHATNGVSRTMFGHKLYCTVKILHKSALLRDAKLRQEWRAEESYRFYFHDLKTVAESK